MIDARQRAVVVSREPMMRWRRFTAQLAGPCLSDTASMITVIITTRSRVARENGGVITRAYKMSVTDSHDVQRAVHFFTPNVLPQACPALLD